MNKILRRIIQKNTNILKNIMRKIINIFEKALKNLSRQINKLHIKLNDYSLNKESQLFEDLTPVENYEENKYYCERIEWALRNKNINNIALTGIYGAGKSSILKSFKKNHCEYRYLDISMATFSGNGGDDSKLEKGILQQMFYKEKYSTIPYSRFKKINKIKIIPLVLRLFAIALTVIGGLLIFKPITIENYITLMRGYIDKYNISHKVGTSLVITFVLLLIYTTSYLTKRFSSRLKIKGISLNGDNAKAEIGEESESSIFNKYIDEIIYFFEETKYDVVIFEDIDRFDNIDIFTSLRQLNSLLNNSKQISHRVVFIYAVKDDMFLNNKIQSGELTESKARTKFFDFIIPTIPKVNSNNASELIIKKLKGTNYWGDLNEQYISEITFLVNDMRLLINICNEYMIYYDRLCEKSNTIKNTKLFAMIVYKNTYPKDFAELQIDKGLVHKAFTREFKESCIEGRLSEIDSEIEQLKKSIESAERETASNINQLRSIYLFELIKHSSSYRIEVNSYNYEPYTLLGDEGFNKLITAGNVRYYNGQGGRASVNGEHINSKLIEGPTYKEREQALSYKEENIIVPLVNHLKDKLDNLKRERSELRSTDLRKVTNTNILKEELVSKQIDNRLIVFLIANGYIDETYPNYISYFYEGTLTKSDQTFIITNLYEESLPFDYGLVKVKEVLKKMKDIQFDNIGCLNYMLIDYLIENCNGNIKYGDYYDRVVKQLSNESDISFKFLEEYIDRGKNIERFITDLSNKWTGFAAYIIQQSKFSQDKIDKYLKNIMINADIKDIKIMDINNVISEQLGKMSNFLGIFSEEKNIKKVINIIKELEVKFSELKVEEYSSDLLHFIFEECMYAINENMIKVILINYGDANLCTFNSRCYTTILNSNCDELINYINKNLDIFVEDVFLILDENNNEDETSIVKLLNSDIELKNKLDIISKEVTVISNISQIPNELKSKIFIEQKVKARWENILNYYRDVNMIDSVLVSYLNNKEISIELSSEKLYSSEELDDSLYEQFNRELLVNMNIKQYNFDYLLKSMGACFKELDMSNVSEARIKSIALSGSLELNNSNIGFLKDIGEKVHIILIKENIEEFISKIENITLDEKDYLLLLKSRDIDDFYKLKIIEYVNANNLINEVKMAEEISKVILDSNMEISKVLAKNIIKENISSWNKIKLFSRIKDELLDKDITEMLGYLSDPYERISQLARRIPLSQSSENVKFLNKIKGYSNISSRYEKDGVIYINTRRK
ncbi:YobI family P-loop NTPase [Clostridium sp. LP20]|uniref:YobI family P-loop NTPase n=1 Tax=Clostridium sp. LP20 TaxID=3418665 RepID=UPI003EE54C66